MPKTYLGDGVYVEFDDRTLDVVLTTENGVAVTNRIVLEPEVLDSLEHAVRAWIYARQHPKEAKG